MVVIDLVAVAEAAVDRADVAAGRVIVAADVAKNVADIGVSDAAI